MQVLLFALLHMLAFQAMAYVPIEQCSPIFTTPKVDCLAKMDDCRSLYGIILKWTGMGTTGPDGRLMGDGGCQCNGYCGFRSQTPCGRDSQCYWNRAARKCYSRITKKPGVPISQCTTRAPTKVPTTKTPTQPPSVAESRTPTVEGVETPQPTSKPTKEPTVPTNSPTVPTRSPTPPTNSPTLATPAPTPVPRGHCHSETGWVMASTKPNCWTQEISKWGWTNGPYEKKVSTIPFKIWLGAGQCDTSKAMLGGTGTVSIDAQGYATISYAPAQGVTFTGEIKAYFGTAPIGSDKAAPGQMPIRVTSNPFKVPTCVQNNFYFYIHFDAKIDCGTGGGNDEEEDKEDKEDKEHKGGKDK